MCPEPTVLLDCRTSLVSLERCGSRNRVLITGAVISQPSAQRTIHIILVSNRDLHILVRTKYSSLSEVYFIPQIISGILIITDSPVEGQCRFTGATGGFLFHEHLQCKGLVSHNADIYHRLLDTIEGTSLDTVHFIRTTCRNGESTFLCRQFIRTINSHFSLDGQFSITAVIDIENRELFGISERIRRNGIPNRLVGLGVLKSFPLEGFCIFAGVVRLMRFSIFGSQPELDCLRSLDAEPYGILHHRI